MADEMAAILDDVTGPTAAPQPMIYTASCRAHHRLSIKGKTYSEYCNTTKIQGRGFINPSLYQGGGCDFVVHPRVKKTNERRSHLSFAQSNPSIYTWLKKRCREKTTNHKRYDPVVCWETSELFTDLHFESRSLALFVCFDIALCASVTHVPDSERMVGGRT